MAPDEFQALKDAKLDTQRYYEKRVAGERWKKLIGLSSLNDPAYSQPHTDEELAAIRKEAEELDYQIQIEALERQISPPMPLYVPPAVHAAVGIDLGVLADIACNNSAALTRQEMKIWLIEFPDGKDYGRHEVHGCADELYNELMQLNISRGRPTYHWLVNEARSLNQKYAPPPPPQPQPQPGPQPAPSDPKPDRPEPHHHEPIHPHPRMPYDPWH